MDTLLMLWSAAPELKTQLIVLALLGQIVLTIWCYSQMSKVRVAAAKAGTVSPDMYKAVGDAEPEALRVYTRLVANQFESPVLFYALLITGLAIDVSSWLTVLFAFIFVALRVIHAREMTGEHNVLKRRKIFIQSFQVLLVLVLDLVLSILIVL